MKDLYIDTETTARTPEKGEICQLSGFIMIDDVIKERFDFKVRPFDYLNLDIYEQGALDTHGYTIEEIQNFEDPIIVYNKLIKIMSKYVNKYEKTDKFWFIGYLSRFDWDFMYSFFEKNNDKYFGAWFWFPPIDVCQLAAMVLKESRASMQDFKLHTVCEVCGIILDKSKLHNALYDIYLTYKLYNRLIGKE